MCTQVSPSAISPHAWPTSPLSHGLCLHHRSDLVVEDFGAPFSTVAVPWMTSRPVIGSVQWLFAAEKSRQYHLPFSWIERLGVRAHRHLVAVSDDLGFELRTRNPRARVTVIANGLDPGAFEPYDSGRDGIVYLGRLERAQKGLDLLIAAYARIADRVEQDLLIGGDGPDRDELVASVIKLGLEGRVRFVGRIAAEDRFSWLAGAEMVAMPSRYETFGMVAAEALAVGTPVVSFDIPCLRALVDDGVGGRVPAFDVEAFADRLLTLATDPARRAPVGPGRAGPGGRTQLGRSGAKPSGRLHRAPRRVGSDRTGTLDECRPADHRHRFVNSPGRSGPAGSPPSVVQLFEGARRTGPSRVAVEDGPTRWTYDELHRAALSAAATVRQRGLGRDDAVGVCLPRSKEAIAAMLGVWMAGAVYVPLDPQYPNARLAEMAGIAGVRSVFVRREDQARFVPWVDVDDAHAVIAPTATATTAGSTCFFSPTDPAYVLFTSGSSGRPKPVQVSHLGLSHVLEWIRNELTAEEMAMSLTTVSFSFDPFILEVLGPLVFGGTIRVIANPLTVGDAGGGVTFLTNTPSVLTELLGAGKLPSTLRLLMTGGEVLSPALAHDLLSQTSIRRLINSYGPAEATLLVTAHEVSLAATAPVPVGHDLPGATVVLLGPDDREVSPGEIGEICIHGPQLADGYRGDQEETDRRFTWWTTSHGLCLRLYRTGDTGRRDRNGALEFHGRLDRQVKVRGFRVEPSEIESVLARHPGVTGAVVGVLGTGGDARIVAHVTGDTGTLNPAALRSWIQDLLPPHMVPGHLGVTESFPTTVHGKVDATRLLEVAASGGATGPPDVGRQSASTGGEAGYVDVVARLAAEVLGYPAPVTGADDFVDDLGGTSLSLFRLLARMEDEFGHVIDVERFIEDTTIVGLARLVGSNAAHPGVLRVHPEGSRAPLFLFHTYLGMLLRYRRLGEHLPEDRPLVGIQVQGFGGAGRPARDSVDAMVDDAVTAVRSLRPEGPYLLGGHSAGGLVAYETARRLAADGADVQIVILIDTPLTRTTIRHLWAESVLNLPDVVAATWTERLRMLRGSLARTVQPARTGEARFDVTSTIARAHHATNRAVRGYQPGCYDGRVAVVRTRQGRAMMLGRDDLGWKRASGGTVTTSPIPGLHNTLFDAPHVASVAGILEALLDSVATPSDDAFIRATT